MVNSTGKVNISLSPFAPENLASQDGFGRPVPRQPAYSPQSSYIWCLLIIAGILPISAAASIYLDRHTPSGRSRIYRVMEMRTDGGHCQESAGTGPVVLKVVRVTGVAFAGHHGPINVRPSFPKLDTTILYTVLCCTYRQLYRWHVTWDKVTSIIRSHNIIR